MKNDKFNGILVPIVSPLAPDGGLDTVKMEQIIHYVFDKGVDGLYVCGGTGDANYLSVEERKQAAELACRLCRENGKLCIVHIGAPSTRDAVTLAKHASSLGVDAISSMPPARSNRIQRRRYYEAISEASGETPIIIYYIPGVTVDITIDEFLELLELKNVIGLKFSDANFFYLKRLLLHKPDLVVFNGNDELLVYGLLSGATGGIGMNYNVFPELFVLIYRCMQKGDVAHAMKLQDGLSAFLDPVFRFGLFESVEHTVALRFGAGTRCFREPNTVHVMNDEQRAIVEESMKTLDALIEEVSREVDGI